MEEIRAERRRRVYKRVALVVASLASLGLIVWLVFSGVRRAELADVEATAAMHFRAGSYANLARGVALIDEAVAAGSDPTRLAPAKAVLLAQSYAEYGADSAAAEAAVAGLSSSFDKQLAQGLLAIGHNDVESARAHHAGLAQLEASDAFAGDRAKWLEAMIRVAERTPTDPEWTAPLLTDETPVALRRLALRLEVQNGRIEQALQGLGQARMANPNHIGLAADEVFYNAFKHEKYGGVGDVADALLANFDPGPRDRAHAQLARAVVHVHAGEMEPALLLLDEAWEHLGAWETEARQLALEMALSSGDAERTRRWLGEIGLPESEVAVYEAWVDLVAGDIMASLASLASLPQERPRVALLQGLALCEQARWDEARPWLERARELLPGRVDVDVALARVDAHGEGEATKMAVRKLEAVTEEEPFAPRAWTGLGEAYLANGSLRKAQRALEKATKRERSPAEAYLRLGELWDGWRKDDGEAAMKALAYFEQAVETNDQYPRYRERLATYLAELGLDRRAHEQMKMLVDRDGVHWPTLLTAVRLEVERSDRLKQPVPEAVSDWIEKAVSGGAPEPAAAVERARVALSKGKVFEAERILLGAVEAAPTELAPRRLLALAKQRQFERDEAIKVLRRGIQALDFDAPLALEWARIEARIGTKKAPVYRARAAYHAMFEVDTPPGELLRAAITVVDIHLKREEERGALTIARNLVERIPWHSGAWLLRAEAQLKAGNTGDASRSAKQATDLDDENAAAWQLRGHCLLRFGKKDEAREAYSKAVELAKGTPRESEYRDNLRGL
jgi:tetratricopeptide (TPR) repeat protein